MPEVRIDTATVLADSRVLLFAGKQLDREPYYRYVTFSYDPATDAWAALPRSPLRARVDALTVWTGSEMLIWGGMDARFDWEGTGSPGDAYLSDGAALTPSG